MPIHSEPERRDESFPGCEDYEDMNPVRDEENLADDYNNDPGNR